MKISRPSQFLVLALLFLTGFMGLPEQGICEERSLAKVLQLDDSDREALTILGEGVVGRALPAWPIKDTAGLMPLREGEWTYRITAGDREGTRQVAAISKMDRKNGQWWHRMVVGDCTEFFSVTGDGAINLVSEMDLKQGVITRYDPIFPLMSGGMKPGETSRVETVVKVYDLNDPTFLKYSGHLKVTHTYMGAYEITVPAGKYEAVLIKSSYAGEVGPAHVVDGGYVFYVKNVGMVASVERMHVTAFLFYDKRIQTPKVLVQLTQND